MYWKFGVERIWLYTICCNSKEKIDGLVQTPKCFKTESIHGRTTDNRLVSYREP
jgi:hypothetical protein